MTAQDLQREPRTLWQIFAVPLLLGILTTVGLVAALVGDGIWDGLSWVTLGVPIVVTLYCLAVSKKRHEAREKA
jgi:hypothetical protein